MRLWETLQTKNPVFSRSKLKGKNERPSTDYEILNKNSNFNTWM